MDLPDYLKSHAQSINTEVNLHLSEFRTEVETVNPHLIPLVDLLIASCQGGKRVRGMLVKLGYELAGGKSSDIIKVSAAVEIFHAAILIHDDVIDESKLRRGQKTLYRKLGGDHYGVSQAIGLGDVGLFLPIKIIAGTHFDETVKNKAIAFFTQTIINTGLGEVLDVELPHLGLVREDDVLTIHRLKTAYYTVSGPLILGAILAGPPATQDKLAKPLRAGGSKDLIKTLEKFGENVGIAFQIQDDILGVFGDEEELGKSVTSDIEEGKNTLLITYALEKASVEQKQILERHYGTGEITEEGLDQVKKVFIETGALDYSKKKAAEYVKIATLILPEITKETRMSNLLQQMAEYLVARTS